MASCGVFVTCHSYVQWVREAVESVLAQTQPPDFITIIQDGYDPPDEDRQLEVEEYADHAGVGYRFLGKNRGISRARNVGYQWAVDRDLDWVTSLDDDDQLNPRYVERMLQAAESAPQVDVWYTDFVYFGGEENHVRVPAFDFKNLKEGNFILSTCFVRPKVWQTVKARNRYGFDEQLVDLGMRWEDYLFWLEAAALGFKFARITAGGQVRVRIHQGSGSEVANRTVPRWRKYVALKMKDLYGIEMWPTSS